jgi:predicted DNA-binding protein
MGAKASRNLHVPLPEGLHDRLRSEAARAGRPATVLAREAIEAWVEEREREAVHEAVVTYARAVAGSRADLDEHLEQAGIEHLLGGRRRRR